MRITFFVITLLVSALALAKPSGFVPGTYPEREAAWKKFTVQGIQLGTPLTKLSGFTCDDRVGEYQHTCVKFLDPKCKGRKTYVKFISYSGDVPKGQGCTYNSANGGTYLDRQMPTVPLFAVAVVGTDTPVPRAYEIRFTFALDQLTRDSNIGKAMLAKYGKPDYENAPMQMRWNVAGIDDLYLEGACGETQGPDAHCLVHAYDGPLLDAERSIKQAAGDAAKIQGGPPAPNL
jgi:hypothetical protein